MTQSVVSGATTTHTYDGNGLRVKRVNGITTVYIFSGGAVIAEYVNGALAREYVLGVQGEHRVAVEESGVTRYFQSDHLSPRLITDGGGATAGTQAHYPFGERWYANGVTTERLFTTYDHDDAASDDYAIHRFHNDRLGRFRTPDSVTSSLTDPQNLNLYAYAASDPVNRVDLDGRAMTGPGWTRICGMRTPPIVPSFDGLPDISGTFLPMPNYRSCPFDPHDGLQELVGAFLTQCHCFGAPPPTNTVQGVPMLLHMWLCRRHCWIRCLAA